MHELSDKHISCVSLHVPLRGVQAGLWCAVSTTFFSSKKQLIFISILHTLLHHFLNTCPALREHKPFFIITVKGKVKCTLVQTLRLCTGHMAHRGSRGIALLFHDHDTGREWGVSTTPWPLYPWERPSTHCTGGWVGPRAGLNRCRKSHPHRDSIHGQSCP
jgi:hypothetical protein